MKTVAIGGLGAIGLPVARAIDNGFHGLSLIAVSVRDEKKAKEKLRDFNHPPRLVDASGLAEADIVVEAAPAHAFKDIVIPAIRAGKTIVIASVGAVLGRPELVTMAKTCGATLIVPSGSIAGLDGVRAASIGGISAATIISTKSPASLADAPFMTSNGIDPFQFTELTRVFSGTAGAAALAFPANANVCAALALAGIGADRTEVEIWVDPAQKKNIHTIHVDSDFARLTLRVETETTLENPRTGRLASLSILSCLRSLSSPLRHG